MIPEKIQAGLIFVALFSWAPCLVLVVWALLLQGINRKGWYK